MSDYPEPKAAMPERGLLGEVARLTLRLGFTAFGGPAAHIAMLRDEVVTRRRWLTEQHFLDLLGATNLIPGPNSTEMVIHVGHERAGWRGLVAAGVLFILLAATMVALLAWAYVRYGATPTVTWELGRAALVDPLTAGLALLAAILLLRFKMNSRWLVLGGGLIGLAYRLWHDGEPAGVKLAPPWRFDVSALVQPGENRIEVLVYNTLANHYLIIPTRYGGPLASGLLGPVRLETQAPVGPR